MWFESTFKSLFRKVKSLVSCYSGTAFGATLNGRGVNAAVHSTLTIKFDLGFPKYFSNFWKLLTANHHSNHSGKLEDLCHDSLYVWDRGVEQECLFLNSQSGAVC